MTQATPTTASPTQQINRRSSRRATVCSFAKIECRRGSIGLGPNILKSVVNLSETGIAVVARGKLDSGQEVELLFNGVDNGKALKRLARVIWSRPADKEAVAVSPTMTQVFSRSMLARAEQEYIAGLQFQSPLPYNCLTRLIKASG
jgi:hypothetical protein